MQVWLQLQDLNLLAGSHGLMCLCDIFQLITVPVFWGPLRFSRICVALVQSGAMGGGSPASSVLSYSKRSCITGRWASVQTAKNQQG